MVTELTAISFCDPFSRNRIEKVSFFRRLSHILAFYNDENFHDGQMKS
jgi:hypothetical protein